MGILGADLSLLKSGGLSAVLVLLHAHIIVHRATLHASPHTWVRHLKQRFQVSQDQIFGWRERDSLTLDEVGHILEGACLLAMPVDGQGRARQRLRYKVADHAAIVQRHPRPVGVEDPHNPNLHDAFGA